MPKRFPILSIVIVAMIAASTMAYYTYQPNAARLDKFRQWRRDPASYPERKSVAGSQCGSALSVIFLVDNWASRRLENLREAYPSSYPKS